MSIGARKALVGLVVTGVFFGALVPAGFWWLSSYLDYATRVRPLPIPAPVALILAAASILIGVFWITWAYSYLVFVGKGLPLEAFGRALHPTKVLVTTGPYAYTRNPMVLGALFVLLGIALLRRSVTAVALIPLLAGCAAAYLVLFEEKALRQRFGDEYEAYRRSVPMLVPWLYRRTPNPEATLSPR